MEARKITIVPTQTQNKHVIMSEAETLSQLKADMQAAGINYEGMTFYEGVSKTELIHDDSVLPTNVPYTNRRTGDTITTNELVFMLTNQNKKIKSGAYSRKECYDIINSKNLKEAVKEVFGKCFTNCSTEDLNAVIERHTAKKCNCCGDEVQLLGLQCIDSGVRGALKVLLEELFDNDCISNRVYNFVYDALTLEKVKNPLVSSYDEDELQRMMDECTQG